MFTQFFYTLRDRKVPVSITEWMTLMEAMANGYIHNLDDFYFLARAILVKSETYYDHYDVAFQEYFNGIEAPPEITEQILEWLEGPLEQMLETQEHQLRAVVEYLKPAHTHFVDLISPTPPPSYNHWEIGISELGLESDLH